MTLCNGSKSRSILGLLWVAVTFTSFFSAQIFAKTVTAKGVSEIDGDKVVAARKIALEGAKRAAVEQVVGTYIRARTDVNNFILAKDQIYSSTAGQINEYTIQTDGITPDGLYEVVILADVKVEDMLSQAAEIQSALGWDKKPRITIIANKQSTDANVASQAKNILTKQLIKEGFDVFDEQEPIYAGFVVDLTTSSASKDDSFQGISITSNELTVNLSVRRLGDNQVLASAVESANKPGVNSSKIFTQLSEKLVKKSWPDLRKQLLSFWKKEKLQARTVLLDVDGIDNLKQAKGFISALSQRFAAIQNIDISEIDNGVGRFVVTYKGWTEQLYEELVAGQLGPNLTVDVTGVKGNKITATKV